MPIATSATWTETAQATNGTATASHAAESGRAHYVTSIVAGFSGAGNTANLELKDGTTTIMQVDVHDDIELEFSHPIRITPGNKVDAVLAAGGSSIVGNVSIAGFTESN